MRTCSRRRCRRGTTSSGRPPIRASRRSSKGSVTGPSSALPGPRKLPEPRPARGGFPARWIRLHYAYPRDFPEPLIDALASQPNVARYLDMPLQHISDEVLRRMKRGRDSAWVRRLVQKIRDRAPGLTFRTSFIVGFPGETEAQFEELCAFVEESRFERVGV